MKNYVMSHCDGDKYVSDSVRKSVQGAVTGVKTKAAKGASTKVRHEIMARLTVDGWAKAPKFAIDSDMSITSMRDGVALCLQTGNVARWHSDLIKLQSMYLDGKITAASMIIPGDAVSKKFNSNVISDTRLKRELAVFKKVYTVPTLIFVLED